MPTCAYLDRSRVGFDIDDISDHNLLLQYGLVYARVQSELLRALDCLEPNNDMRDGLSVPAQRVLGLCWSELGDLAFIHLLGFFYPQACTRV